MELLGVQFDGFACFEKRLVPLKPGIQILVGKNNAGKTALLRGLATLRALPIGTPQSLDQEIAAYARTTTPVPTFGLHVWYRVGLHDWHLIGEPGKRAPFAEGEDVELDIQFRVWPHQNLVGLEGARLIFGTSEVPIITKREGSNYFQLLLNQDNQSRHELHIDNLLDRKGEVGSWPTLRPQHILSEVAPLTKVERIDAHRFVQQNMPAREEREFPSGAANLAPYLLTLRGSNRRTFNRIEEFIVKVFPEFESLNPELRENSVRLTLTLRGTDTKVPLTNCGAGVEQLLVLVTFLLITPPGTTILMDEPHTYLHPSAEREFVALLMQDKDRSYVVSTHSPVLINSVPPERIINVVAGEEGSFKGSETDLIGPILQSLGYKNSDFLLYDRLILGEGKSDAAIIPILLKNSGQIQLIEVDRTGFPVTEGTDSANTTTKQTVILRYEKLLDQLDMAAVPRLYLRDGDATPDEKTTLQGTKQARTGIPVPIKFLPRTELENYLLVPEAIAKAVSALRELEGPGVKKIAADEVRQILEHLFANEGDNKLFPTGRGEDPLRTSKGFIALSHVFNRYGLRYHKERTGALIAGYVTPENQPALAELVDLVKEIYERVRYTKKAGGRPE